MQPCPPFLFVSETTLLLPLSGSGGRIFFSKWINSKPRETTGIASLAFTVPLSSILYPFNFIRTKAFNAISNGVLPTVCDSRFDGWLSGGRYQLNRVLGKGSYGEVGEATDIQTGRKVAIKRMQSIFDEITDAKRVYREMHILRLVRRKFTSRACFIVCINILSYSYYERYIFIYIYIYIYIPTFV